MPYQVDLRLEVAKLAEGEFVGPSEPTGDNDPDFDQEMLENICMGWPSWATMNLLTDQAGYTLHVGPETDRIQVALSFNGGLIGIYEGEFLFVDANHRKRRLGAELVLAAYCKVQWIDQTRKFTTAGHATFKAAHRLASEHAS